MPGDRCCQMPFSKKMHDGRIYFPAPRFSAVFVPSFNMLSLLAGLCASPITTFSLRNPHKNCRPSYCPYRESRETGQTAFERRTLLRLQGASETPLYVSPPTLYGSEIRFAANRHPPLEPARASPPCIRAVKHHLSGALSVPDQNSRVFNKISNMIPPQFQ